MKRIFMLMVGLTLIALAAPVQAGHGKPACDVDSSHPSCPPTETTSVFEEGGRLSYKIEGKDPVVWDGLQPVRCKWTVNEGLFLRGGEGI